MIALEEVNIHGQVLKVWGKVHPRAKYFRLRFAPERDHLLLTLPPGASLKKANAFVRKAFPWIERHHQPKPREEILHDRLASRLSPEGGLHFSTTHGLTCLQSPAMPESKMPVDTLIRLGLRHLLHQFCHETSKRFAHQLGVRVTSLRIRNSKTRWGSCSSKGALSYASRLVFCPPFVVTYLCAHEVAHLKEMNHSRSFWAVVKELDPHYLEAKAWLKRYGPTTFLYGDL